MRECELIGEMFLEIRDNDAAPEEGRQFNEHLNECTDCREDFMWYGRTVDALGSLEEVAPPPDFLPQLSEKLDCCSLSTLDRIRNFFSRSFALPIPAGVPALAIGIIACLVLYQDGRLLGNLSLLLPSSEQGTANSTAPAAERYGVDSRVKGAASMAAANWTTKSPRPMPAPFYAKSAGDNVVRENTHAVGYPTTADRIGADNLTVESDKADHAVNWVKRFLPRINGRLVGEQVNDRMGEKILRVMIPSKEYGSLTTQLIHYGAVASGAGNGTRPATLDRKAGDKVLLYIRFASPRR